MNKYVSIRACGANEQGFTLLEMVVIVALTAAFLVTTFFVYNHWIERNELETIAHIFEDTLTFARETAMTSRTMIEVCPLDADEKCGKSWENGQWVFVVQNHKTLRVVEAVPRGYTVLWRPTLADFPFVRFHPDGFTADGIQGSFYVCAQKDHALSARIVLLRTGRTRSLMGDFAECRT